MHHGACGVHEARSLQVAILPKAQELRNGLRGSRQQTRLEPGDGVHGAEEHRDEDELEGPRKRPRNPYGERPKIEGHQWKSMEIAHKKLVPIGDQWEFMEMNGYPSSSGLNAA